MCLGFLNEKCFRKDSLMNFVLVIWNNWIKSVSDFIWILKFIFFLVLFAFDLSVSEFIRPKSLKEYNFSVVGMKVFKMFFWILKFILFLDFKMKTVG